VSDVGQTGEVPNEDSLASEVAAREARNLGAPSSGITSAEHLACALHEVSNALTVVLGWLDVAEAADPSEVKKAIGVARQHARRGQIMARRSIGADVESTHQEQRAAEVLRFAVTSIKPQASSRGIEVTCQCGAGTDVPIVSPDRVLQILTNLLMNGLSFSPRGGHLVVSLDRKGEALSFQVQDEGPGVERERRPSLFAAPNSTRPGGAGIGLPHSRHLAREAGGDLRLGDCDSGARFELIWPMTSLVPSLPSAPLTGTRSLSGARVLVVEDDLAISALIDLSFSARGAEVIVVKDADEFVSVLRARPVLDLVLLDLSPIDDALSDALDSLDQVAPDAPIIIMSGQPGGIPPEAEDRVASWVRKPFDMEELLDSAASLLRPPALAAGDGNSR